MAVLASTAPTDRGAHQYTPRERWSPAGTWSPTSIVAALVDWNDLLGQPPRSYEWSSAGSLRLRTPGCRIWRLGYPRWPSTPTVVRHFGTWNAALQAAELPLWRPSTPPASEREERIRVAQRLASRGLRSGAIAELIGVAPRTVRAYLTAGHCVECGVYVVVGPRCPSCAARRARPPARSREDLLAAVRTWARETGRPPTQEDWAPSAQPRSKWAREYPRWPSYMTVTTVFGSWMGALEAAGFQPNRRLWTRTQIADALAGWAAEHGGAPLPRELTYGGAGMPTLTTIRKAFGSYAAALEHAGLEPHRRYWHRDEIVAAMRRWSQLHGRPPRDRDWTRSCRDHPHATTVRQRFGSWATAAATAFPSGGRPPQRFESRGRGRARSGEDEKT